MNRFSTTIAGVAGLAVSTIGVANGADMNGRSAIKGIGQKSCQDFTAAQQQRSQDYFVFGGWVQGAVTAQNMQLDDTFDLAPWQQTETLLLGLANYCMANPEQRFARAVNGLMQSLARDRLQASSPLIRATVDDKTVLIYESILLQIQEFLLQKGMLDGVPSGIFDEPTRAALVAYQKDTGLTENGLPDQPTLLKLMSTINRRGP